MSPQPPPELRVHPCSTTTQKVGVMSPAVPHLFQPACTCPCPVQVLRNVGVVCPPASLGTHLLRLHRPQRCRLRRQERAQLRQRPCHEPALLVVPRRLQRGGVARQHPAPPPPEEEWSDQSD
jgi:hypothetical protein